MMAFCSIGTMKTAHGIDFMHKLLTAAFCLLAASVFGASPDFRNFNQTQFGTQALNITIRSGALLTNPVVASGSISGSGLLLTNVPFLTGTNTIWVSELRGSDTAYVIGDPTRPAKTLTNALRIAQNNWTNGTIITYPESFDVTTVLSSITLSNVTLNLIAWGSTFTGTNGGFPVFVIGTNCNFKEFGGYWDFARYGILNGARPFDGINAASIYLFGVKVDGVLDNFFWSSEYLPCTYTFEHCDFSSAWDMNQTSFTQLGTNSVFTARYCSYTKNRSLFMSAVFCAINGSQGSLILEHCNFSADYPGNTNSIRFIIPSRTNIIKGCTFSFITTSSSAVHIDTLVNQVNRKYLFEGNSFTPHQVLNQPPAQFSSSYWSNLHAINIGSPTVPVTNIYAESVVGGTFYGNGSGITNGNPALATNNATATDGMVLSKSGTNLLFIANGTGDNDPTNTAPFTILTNDFAGNTLYTNRNQRATVVTGAGLSSSGGFSDLGLLIDQDQNGTFDQTFHWTLNVAGATTNSLVFYLQPNARFYFTNLSTGLAAAGLAVGQTQWVFQ